MGSLKLGDIALRNLGPFEMSDHRLHGNPGALAKGLGVGRPGFSRRDIYEG